MLSYFIVIRNRYIKYPRTYHLPWSPGTTSDDRLLKDTKHFENKEIVITVKMDGEQSNCYHDYFHARSIDVDGHPSRDWIKNLHAKICYDIPEGWRFCGENLHIKHSIHYKNLKDYFYLFSVWNEKNECLSWDETIEWSQLLNLELVPELYRGIWNEKTIQGLVKETFNNDECEGFVCRLTSGFPYGQFKNSVAKYVRKGHVTTSNHWKYEKLIMNKLKGKLK